jgi:ketosteroid isomerase-like protein
MLLRSTLAALLASTALHAQATATPFDPPRRTELATTVVDVPLFRRGDFYFVNVHINGRPFVFTVETGASFHGIGPHVAQALSLPVDTVPGPAGPGGAPAQYARIDSLRMGGATLVDFRARVSPTFDGGDFVGDGIISLAAYRQLLATLDFPNRRLRLERGELPPPNGRDVVPILGDDRGGRVDIPFEIGGVTIPMVVDTRSFIWFIVPDSLESRIQLAAPARPTGEARGPAMGTFQLRGARASNDLRIGNVTVQKPAIEFRNRPGAVLGMPFLEQVVMTIDQAQGRVRIVRPGGTPITVPALRWELYGAPTPESAEREVRALDSVWARNYATHDTATALKLMADDFRMTAVTGPRKDRAAEMRDIRPTPGLRMNYFRTSGVTVTLNRLTATVTGLAEWAFDMNGRTATMSRAYTAVYRRGGPFGWELMELTMRAP